MGIVNIYMVYWWGALLVFILLVKTGYVNGCVCPAATVLSRFPSAVPADVCCLNYSGSSFSHVHWSVFTNDTNIQILDLSNCNITHVDMSATGIFTLEKVYLNNNRLTTLPQEFLSSQTSLMEVDLEGNLLLELPQGFLQDSDSLQMLNLQGNQLQFLPDSVLLKPNLLKLELDGNPWDCSCLLLEGLDAGRGANRTTRLQDLVIDDVCRPAGLTALFIVLPLLILSALVLCWCCGRKSTKKEGSVFNTSKKRASNCNDQKHRSKAPPVATEQNKAAECKTEGILKNQLLLRPASTLLGSTRDIYEEVEIKLGSVESLPSALCPSSTDGRLGFQEPHGTSKTELDTVSVTEVMKDSADREKAYLTQSTEYYSLVPGIELEDSDHGEYESVNLS
uniref:LRRCT domain-containing protein n=1 Tax=Sphaeramia orbicularis TaxID=375764 RepID=A0A673BQA2_9TELE